ncbi:MAG: hypothetical protein K2P20_08040 [Oscillospiraceae bacterium]|nr:hypothetical protein [Oscillospiraceae bacterium]
MSRRLTGPALAGLLLLCLCGCASLLERSYSVVEPYAVRYWDSGDTLRADTYQDLVTSLLLLVEQRAEEGTVRCGGDAGSYQQASAACREVRTETVLGSYLLEDLTFTREASGGWTTLTLRAEYREDAGDPASIMALSDSQSLVDLLRINVREEHGLVTARFVYNTSRQEVYDAMQSLWQELCQGGLDQKAAEEPPAPEDAGGENEEEPPSMEEEPPLPEDFQEEPPEEEPAYPPCPWTARFYPDQETAGIVEILMDPAATRAALEQAHGPAPPPEAGLAGLGAGQILPD